MSQIKQVSVYRVTVSIRGQDDWVGKFTFWPQTSDLREAIVERGFSWGWSPATHEDSMAKMKVIASQYEDLLKTVDNVEMPKPREKVSKGIRGKIAIKELKPIWDRKSQPHYHFRDTNKESSCQVS